MIGNSPHRKGRGCRRIAADGVLGWYAGFFAAIVIALFEILWPSTPLGNSLDDVGKLVGYCVLLASLSCIVGSPMGALAASIGSTFMAVSGVGLWLKAARRWFVEQRELDRLELGRRIFSYAVAGTVALVAWAGASASFSVFAQQRFHHQGLIAVLVVAVCGMLFVVVGAVGLLLVRLIDLVLRPLCRIRPFRWLASIPAAMLAALAIFTAAVGWVVYKNIETVRVMEIRAPLLVIGFLMTFIGLFLLFRWLHRSGRWRLLFRPRFFLPVAASTYAVVLLSAVAFGERPSARIALSSCSSLGMPVASLLRSITDFDGDGASPWLGGGDCDDFDREVGPGAFDWPDDGMDQNCMGGDASSQPPEPAPFYDVPESVPEDLSVVLISIDSVRADHLGCFGYTRPTSPNMDELARQGTLFRAGYASSSATRFSLASLLSGRYAIPGMRRRGKGASRSWPEVMASRGYTTAAVMAHPYFRKSRRFTRRFKILDNDLARFFKGGEQTFASKQIDRGIKMVEERLKGRKFFLWMHSMDPHHAFAKIPRFSFGDDRVGRYDGEIRHTDHHIGRFFDRLKRLDLWDSTIVIVTGDHGQGLGEHGIETHSHRLYQSLVHVPLIMHVPGIEPSVVEEPVSHADLMPTVLNLLRTEPNEELDGASALGHMTGQVDTPRRVFAEIEMRDGRRYALIESRWKLIYNAQDDTFELYDIVNDPGELQNLVEDEPEIFARLLAPLSRRMERDNLNPQVAPLLKRSVSFSPFEIPRRIEANLGDAIQLLGYDVRPKQPRKGQKLKVTLFFKSLERLPGNHRLFVHVRWPGTKKSSNVDHHPVEGAYPIRFWRPGQYIRDEFTARPPRKRRSGHVTINVGVYEGRKRLKVVGDVPVKRNSILLTKIEITD